MPIPLTCDCGRKIRVSDELAGRRVKCPECGEPQTVPTVRSTVPVPKPRVIDDDEPAMIAFRCGCGRQLKAKAAFAGRSVRCPECDDVVRIPASRDEDARTPAAKRRPVDDDDAPAERGTRIQTEKPALRSRPARDDDDDIDDPDDDDRPRRVKSRKRKIKKKRGAPVWPWIAAGVGLLLLIGAGVTLFLVLRRSDAKVDDLFPTDAIAFISVRPADIADSALAKQVAEKLPPNVRNAGQGGKEWIKFDEVERMTFVWTDANAPDAYYIVLTTKQPFDKAAGIATLADAREAEFEGKKYHVGLPRNWTLGDGFRGFATGLARGANLGQPQIATQTLAYYFYNSRSVVIGQEVGVKKAISRAAKPVTVGPMADAVSKVLNSPDQILIAYQYTAEQRAIALNNLAGLAEMKDYLPLYEAKGGSITLNATASINLSIAFDFPDDVKAAAAKAAADKGIQKLKTLIANANLFGAAFLPKGAEGALGLANNILKSLAPLLQGQTVSVGLKIESADVLKAVEAGLAAAQQVGAPPAGIRPGFPGQPGVPGPPARIPPVPKR
jgi:DNA-directed RNA polymerase subunit RPC12/RpoP